MTLTNAAAAKWMEAGLIESKNCMQNAQKTKESALRAGYFFLLARKSFGHGDWGEFLLSYENKIKRRTVERYCEFTSAALEWTRKQNPTVTKPEKLLELAIPICLDSPKPYIALARDLGQFRLFGAYDEVRYAINKRKGDQLELNFSYETVIEQLSAIDQAPNARKLSERSLEELEAKCMTTAEWCRAVRADRQEQKAKTLELIQ